MVSVILEKVILVYEFLTLKNYRRQSEVTT